MNARNERLWQCEPRRQSASPHRPRGLQSPRSDPRFSGQLTPRRSIRGRHHACVCGRMMQRATSGHRLADQSHDRVEDSPLHEVQPAVDRAGWVRGRGPNEGELTRPLQSGVLRGPTGVWDHPRRLHPSRRIKPPTPRLGRQLNQRAEPHATDTLGPHHSVITQENRTS